MSATNDLPATTLNDLAELEHFAKFIVGDVFDPLRLALATQRTRTLLLNMFVNIPLPAACLDPSPAAEALERELSERPEIELQCGTIGADSESAVLRQLMGSAL